MTGFVIEESANEFASLAGEMYSLVERLYPICRSITGNGVRQTLSILNEVVPLKVHEIKTGTQVFDWVVPKEWNINDAYIKDGNGQRIVDFKQSNLHVVNYSTPINKRMTLEELKPHLHSIESQPDAIPYKTSYYNPYWGFCLSHKELSKLQDEEYEVSIDSSLEEGSLTYAEIFIKGSSNKECLFYTHTCHPSLCNDNLSGIAVAIFLARILKKSKNKYSYRFVFGPGAIGSITWLSINEKKLDRIKYGLVMALLGDSGSFTYKKSRNGNGKIDQIVQKAMADSGSDYKVINFDPYGYDERQFCSPGINLPVGRITRTPNGEYSEYHTSLDNLDLVKPEKLAQSLSLCLDIINIIEHDKKYLNTNPKCEPQLGKRGLYSKSGGGKSVRAKDFALLWVLNQSDGENTLLDIAEKSGMAFKDILLAADLLNEAGLLREGKK